MKKETKSKILKGIGIGLIGLALGGAGGYALMPQKTITQTVEVPKIVEKEVVKEVPQECPICEECTECVHPVTEEEYNNTVTELENTQEELLDVENTYSDFLDFIYDVDGNAEFILDDLDDDEVDLIANRIGFVYDAISLADNEVKDELADELDDEVFNVGNGDVLVNKDEVEFDEDDIEDIDPKIDLEDIEFSGEDFEDDEITLNFYVDFEHDDEDYTANVDVEIKDKEVDDFDINTVKRDE